MAIAPLPAAGPGHAITSRGTIDRICDDVHASFQPVAPAATGDLSTPGVER